MRKYSWLQATRTSPWEPRSDRSLIYFSAARRVFFFFTLVSFDIYFFSASFCRNDENQFRVCVPSGNRTNAHPRLASRFITIPFQEIHNKRSFIFFDDERMAAAKPIYIYFFYFFFPFSFIYLFCSRVQCAAYRRILGFHIFEITVFARVLPRVIIVSPRKKTPWRVKQKLGFLSADTFPGIGLTVSSV